MSKKSRNAIFSELKKQRKPTGGGGGGGIGRVLGYREGGILVYRDVRRTLQVKVWLHYASMIINLQWRHDAERPAHFVFVGGGHDGWDLPRWHHPRARHGATPIRLIIMEA